MITLVCRDVNLVARRRIDARAQAAPLELFFHLVGVPGRDAERNVVDAGAAGGWPTAR